MKYLKLFEIDTFEEDWEEFEDEPSVDYLSAFISYDAISISENEISIENEIYIYFNTPSDKSIPYNKKYITDIENIDKLPEGLEYIVKVNDRKDILKYKNKVENFINDNLKKYFNIDNWKFKLDDSFYIYPLDIVINKKDFEKYINKYFFK